MLLILSLITLGCTMLQEDKSNDKYIVNQVYSVDSLRVTRNANKALGLRIKATVPNPCYEFSGIETKQQGDSLFVRVFAKMDRSVTCIMVLGTVQADLSLRFEQAGIYKLIFEGRSKNLVHTVKVNE